MEMQRTLYVTNRADWRKWLRANHRSETEVWLIFYKKHSGKPRIPYDDAVEEALCFGWIDSIVKRIDDDKYAQKFTPRKDPNKWSDSNKSRVKKLIKEGRMTQAGLDKIGQGALAEGRGSSQAKEIPVPRYFTDALKANKKSWENFNKLAPSYRRQYVAWVTEAKREDTRAKRLKETVALLKQNKKLGMK